MKPRVAFFDFASCEGCQLQVVNLEEKILDLIDVVEVVSFREAMKEHSDDYDIAFIEGSIQRPMDEERLKRIRKNAQLLVAIGACACIGGVNKLRNEWTVDEVKEEVYENADIEGNRFFDVFPTKAVDEVVDVDFYIPGCPINRNEFAKIVSQIAIGRMPRLPSYPVCVECKKNENICVFELGKYCLGPVTRAGCDAICPSFQDGCEGCRGFLDDPKMECQKDILRKHGITLDELMKRFNMFNYKKGVY
jgi:coenzyme F420-reducing hydrogenase gamma subunit